MQNDTITVPLKGGVQLIVPAERVGAFLRDLINGEPAGASIADTDGAVTAGLTIGPDGQPARLVLLPGEFQGTWKDAIEWAQKQGGELPSRFDALVLFKNLKAEFKGEAYWTAEQHADDPGYAWCQLFTWGSQNGWHKDYELRARAVRRLPI